MSANEEQGAHNHPRAGLTRIPRLLSLERSMLPRDGLCVISTADQVTWSFFPKKRLRDLTCHPLRGRMRCYIDPGKISAGHPDYNEDVKQLESNAVGIPNRSIAAICIEWLRTKASYPCGGGRVA
jgi:hypothetical protein